jgi:phosphoribosylaminoimidazole-succinocarboxamide synthase
MVSIDIEKAVSQPPMVTGRSKEVFRLGPDLCLVRLIPSLTSFTYGRDELVAGTEKLRLDFYELAARRLEANGVETVFRERVSDDMYVARLCPSPPFEVIVKNLATGSTIRKYPGLFEEGHRFHTPVVKFDYRTDPEDQPIAEDYVRECGFDPAALKTKILLINQILRDWLQPNDLWDFCVVFGRREDGAYVVQSEVSPDCMRLRSPDGEALDKDLFRQGRSHEEIIQIWSRLNRMLAASPQGLPAS